MKQYSLGIDIGTTSTKLILISNDGKIVCEASQAHNLISLHRNWAEENADEWWQNVLDALKEIKEKAPEEYKQISCIGCTGMVPAIVLLDKDGNVLRNTIQQNDARCMDQIEYLTAKIDQNELYSRTGGKTNQQHILPRLLWVKENEADVWDKVDCVMGSYDYILYKLSGEKVVELNWAAESGCFDIRTKEWITDYVTLCDMNPAMLPAVKDPMEIAAKTSAEIEELTGLPCGIPIVGGSADHVASTLASGIIDEGDLLIKFGGAGDILYCTEELKTSDKLFFDYHDVPNKYLLNGCMASSGSLVKWFTHDILRSDDKDILKELDAEAEKLPPASDGLIILPYFLGEKTPIFDPSARGIMFGLTLSHGYAHIFKAIMESVVYGFRHHIDVLTEMGYKPKQVIASDGGAKSPLWCQISADILNADIKAYPSHPGSGLGVAFVAGMGIGMFKDWSEIKIFLSDYKEYKPNPDAVKVYEKAYQVYRRLYPELKEDCSLLEQLYK
ncbi:MAG: FGGY-family carbohydrate kinase [Prevotellaceae bacterium]|nr:FGGY-family carbohydrate kinase [Prevotellaceae bacterium]